MYIYDIIHHKQLLSQTKKAMNGGGIRFVELYISSHLELPKIIRANIIPIDEIKSDTICMIILEDVSENMKFEEQLVESERLAGMGLLARSVAHELGNPLSIMSSTLQYIKDSLMDSGSQSISEAIETIKDSVDNMHKTLRSLSEFPGTKHPQFELVDITYVVSQIVSFIYREAETHNIVTHLYPDENLPKCQIIVREIKQVILNLCKNAIEAMPNGGELQVEIHKTLLDKENGIQIVITDTGIGIDPSALKYIFRPLYTTKPGGMGLGLSFCRRVIEEHGGEVTVKSQIGKGSSFTISIPARQRMVVNYE
jgi:signal transduction histidine kinase